MNTTYLLQGERMRLIYGDFAIPVASLSLFNSLIILILVPVVDRFVYPLLERLGMPLSKLQRIGEYWVWFAQAPSIMYCLHLLIVDNLIWNSWDTYYFEVPSFSSELIFFSSKSHCNLYLENHQLWYIIQKSWKGSKITIPLPAVQWHFRP